MVRITQETRAERKPPEINFNYRSVGIIKSSFTPNNHGYCSFHLPSRTSSLQYMCGLEPYCGRATMPWVGTYPWLCPAATCLWTISLSCWTSTQQWQQADKRQSESWSPLMLYCWRSSPRLRNWRLFSLSAFVRHSRSARQSESTYIQARPQQY